MKAGNSPKEALLVIEYQGHIIRADSVQAIAPVEAYDNDWGFEVSFDNGRYLEIHATTEKGAHIERETFITLWKRFYVEV